MTPHYTLAASEAKPSTPPRYSGRDQIAINDIQNSSPQKLIPSRNEYRDTMMVEDEFKVQKKKAQGRPESDTDQEGRRRRRSGSICPYTPNTATGVHAALPVVELANNTGRVNKRKG